jgi:hypothetical protein
VAASAKCESVFSMKMQRRPLRNEVELHFCRSIV